ncbi:hypothetical protein [Amnibacterium endophyticum]|uniref:Uncharacterized protein n=1 Tax=Amnibacterium endophyticum TaxID=2109337 RepID=A0ABW4LDB8_9MICO
MLRMVRDVVDLLEHSADQLEAEGRGGLALHHRRAAAHLRPAGEPD